MSATVDPGGSGPAPPTDAEGVRNLSGGPAGLDVGEVLYRASEGVAEGAANAPAVGDDPVGKLAAGVVDEVAGDAVENAVARVTGDRRVGAAARNVLEAGSRGAGVLGSIKATAGGSKYGRAAASIANGLDVGTDLPDRVDPRSSSDGDLVDDHVAALAEEVTERAAEAGVSQAGERLGDAQDDDRSI